MAYEIEWSKSALKDLRKQCNEREIKRIIEDVERVAALQHPTQDHTVKPLAMTNNNWYRIKVSMKPKPMRVFFSLKKNPPTIIIEVVLPRDDNTYKLAKVKYNTRGAA